SRFEERLAKAADDEDCDGVICGHIHTPMAKLDCGRAYFNTGDWIEHRTALVEHADGEMELIHLPICQGNLPRNVSHERRNGFGTKNAITCEPVGASLLPTAAGAG